MKTAHAKEETAIEAVAAYLRLWDPGARSKYDKYAPKIYTLLRTGASARQVAERLDAIRNEQSGSKPPQSADNRTAIRLVSWYRRTQ
jgi:hypothetical protein